MAVTYGFYDSLSGDRKYNANQMSKLFQGIITDGIFQSIGNSLVVSASTGMQLSVGSGRAWFNNTWTDNDAALLVTVLPSEAVLDRIDTVVVEVNSDIGTRANAIKVIKGTPASSPVAPTLASTSSLHQYALCDVFVGHGVTSIITANITNRIGTTGAPLITGVLQSIDITTLLAQWNAQFTTWFTNLVNQLTGVQVTNLQNQINTLNAQFDNYVLTPSIASNNLTVALKDLTGADPSAASPMYFKVGNTKMTLTSALSVTINASYGDPFLWDGRKIQANDSQLFVYIINNNGTLQLGLSPSPALSNVATNYRDAVGQTGAAHQNNIVMSGTRNATNSCTIIGRINVNQADNNNWQNPTNAKVINRFIDETDDLNWTPTITPTAPMTYTGVTINMAHYKIIRGRCKVKVDFTGTTGGTASISINFTTPLTPTYLEAAWNISGPGLLANPAFVMATAYLAKGDPTHGFIYNNTFGNYALSAGTRCVGDLEFEVG